MIRIECPHCHKPLNVTRLDSGIVACPLCGNKFRPQEQIRAVEGNPGEVLKEKSKANIVTVDDRQRAQKRAAEDPDDVVKDAQAADHEIIEEEEFRRKPKRARDEIADIVDEEVVGVETAQDRKRIRRRRKRKRKRELFHDFLGNIPLSYQAQTNIGVAIGIVLHAMGLTLIKFARPFGLFLGLPIFLLGDLFFIWGCCAYARMKGHPAVYGLFGMIGCIGLIILVSLPYRSPDDEG